MEFKFKEGAQAYIGSEDVFYAMTDGGYLSPSSVLEDPAQAKMVSDAVWLVHEFISACFDHGVIEEM